MNSSRNWALVLLILIATPALPENKKHEEAKTLIARAKQFSDIRADGLPPFQMKVSFKVIKKASTIEGTYTETWASSEKWRSETVVGDFHQVIVVNANKRWTSNTSSTAPTATWELGFKMAVPKFFPNSTDRIKDQESSSRMMRCLESKPDYFGGRSALCLDKITGLVAENVQPVARGDRTVDRTCIYSDYQQFGERMFPRSIRCSEDHEPVLESTLIELTKVAAPDAALFAPLADARESVNCRGIASPPKPIYQPDPVPPRRENLRYPVVLWLALSTDGIPTDVRVVRSYDPAFDRAALDAVRAWRFKPASCDGQPMEVQINVEVTFRAF